MADELSRVRESLIREAWAKWNAGERDPAALGAITDDFVLDSAMTGRTFYGHEGLLVWMREIDANFDAWELRLDELRSVSADRWVGFGSVHLRGKGSGIEFDQPVGWVFDFEGEKVARMQNLPSHAAAEEAARK